MTKTRLALLILLLGLMGIPAVQADILKINPQDEISVGRDAAARFESGRRFLGGRELARIRRIGAQVAEATGRSDLPWSFKLVDSDEINAICFPGGYVYVFQGLLDRGLSDDMLAGILGHEVTHAVKSHAFKQIFAAEVLRRAQIKLTGREREHAAVQVVDLLTTRGVGRRLELESDRLGVQWAHKAGYDPAGLISVLEIFQGLESGRPPMMQRLMLSHPPSADRIKKVRPVVEKLKR